MSSIERPLFFEGQILAPTDLESTVEHSRGQMARHGRYLHTLGIAFGLGLTGTPRKTSLGQEYKDVSLAPGMAVDGWGREIVVPESVLLEPELFIESGVKQDGAWHPVFLQAIDNTPSAAGTSLMGRCGSTQSANRRLEQYVISFGSPGDELDLEVQTAATVTDGPGTGTWRVLLGFVKWDSRKVDLFEDVADSNLEGISRRYAGALADEVVARSGKLQLRARPRTTAGKPILTVDEAGGGQLQFGLENTGVFTPVFTVKANGDVVAQGSVSGALSTGAVLVESGVIFDGLQVPLPTGVSQAQVDSGSVTIQVSLTPRFPGSQMVPLPPAAERWFSVPAECRVDGRRAICRYVWYRHDDNTIVPELRPGVCNYTILAFVPAGG